MADLQEAQIRAALGRYLNDDEMIELLDQAERSEDSLAFWRTQYQQRENGSSNGTSISDEDGKLLGEYKLTVEPIEEEIRNDRGEVVRYELAGYVIRRQTSFGAEYCDRRTAWTPSRGECIPFLDPMEARQTAIAYAASMNHGATQFKNLPQQISITLTVCPTVPEPAAGVRVGKELTPQCTRALEAVKQGMLAANILGRDGKAVDTYAAALDYVCWRIACAMRK